MDKFAEPGVDAVGNRAAFEDPGDRPLRGRHVLHCPFVHAEMDALITHPPQFRQRYLAGRKDGYVFDFAGNGRAVARRMRALARRGGGRCGTAEFAVPPRPGAAQGRTLVEGDRIAGSRARGNFRACERRIAGVRLDGQRSATASDRCAARAPVARLNAATTFRLSKTRRWSYTMNLPWMRSRCARKS